MPTNVCVRMILLLLPAWQLTVSANTQSLDSLLATISREGNRPLVIFYQTGNCIKCELMLNAALRAATDSTLRMRIVPILVVEATRLSVSNAIARSIPRTFGAHVIADNWSFAAPYQIAAGNNAWVLPDLAHSSFKKAALDEHGLIELLTACGAVLPGSPGQRGSAGSAE